MQNTQHEFSVEYSMFMGIQYNYWGSVLTTVGYIALINILLAKGAMSAISEQLAAVGRMAFSNYILQSLICTFVFYGLGLGFFGEFSRLEQIFLVFAIWVIQLKLSTKVLNVWHFGPLEWRWRSLTYMRRQPLRKTTSQG